MKTYELTGIAVLFCLIFYKADASSSDKVLEHPESSRIALNGSANFTCRINCSQLHALKWRFYIPAVGATRDIYIKSSQFRRFSSRNGVTVESIFKQKGNCRSPDGEITQVIQIIGIERTNSTIVQCAAVTTRRAYADFYSKFAVLQIEPPPELPTADSLIITNSTTPVPTTSSINTSSTSSASTQPTPLH